MTLVALIVAAYAPSLNHPPRSDQWAYLTDTRDRWEVRDVIASTYSYNRTRATAPGDTDLFRPILFAVLGAERAFLEGDVFATQAIGIGLHCAVCLLLLTLLRRIERSTRPCPDGATRAPSLAPVVVTLFFALNPAIQELVIWSHLHGYLVFLILVLGSVLFLLRCISRQDGIACWCAWALALLSAFAYELGQLFAVLAGGFLAGVLYTRGGLARAIGLIVPFLAIPLLYQAINHADLDLHRGHYVPENRRFTIRERLATPDTAVNSARFVLFTDVQPFFPTALNASLSNERLDIAETLWHEPFSMQSGPTLALSVLVLVLAIAFALGGLGLLLREKSRPAVLTIALFAGLAAAYAAANVLGRMNLQPRSDILSSNSYYAYPALLFLLAGGFAASQGLWHRRCRLIACARAVLLVGLTTLAFVGALKVHAVNVEIARDLQDVATPIRAIHDFIRAHRNEPRFSLEIDYPNSDPIPERHGRPITKIVFGRWLKEDAKYRVAIREGVVVVFPTPCH